MKFGPVPLAQAEGALLAHGQQIGQRRLPKGHILDVADLADAAAAGVIELVVARLEPSDVAEDDAAEEDLLAMDPEFDAHALLEDDVLLAMPLVPRHAACHAPLSAALEDDLPHPFAALAALKAPKQ